MVLWEKEKKRKEKKNIRTCTCIGNHTKSIQTFPFIALAMTTGDIKQIAGCLPKSTPLNDSIKGIHEYQRVNQPDLVNKTRGQG